MRVATCCLLPLMFVFSAGLAAVMYLLTNNDVTPLGRRWGPRPDSSTVIPFTVDFSPPEYDQVLAALARWDANSSVSRHDVVYDGTEWGAGISTIFLQKAVRYWRDDYDWRGVVAELNEVPQFTTDLLGLRIHFWHIQARGRGGDRVA